MMEFIEKRPDHSAVVRSNLLRYDAKIGMCEPRTARTAVAPRSCADTRNLLLRLDKDFMALGHGATNLHQVVDGRRNTLERFLQRRIGHARDIADLDELGLKFGQFDQGRLN